MIPEYLIRTRTDEIAIHDGCFFDRDEAERVCRFIETHVRLQSTGEPIQLLPWQRRFLIYPLFGWKRKDGYRRFKSAYVSMAKKNGKTTILAAILLALLLIDREPSSFCVSAANDREQAALIYRELEYAIRNDAKLKDACRCVPSSKTIQYGKGNATYKSLSCDVPSKHGLNCHGVVYDEIAFFKSPDLYTVLRYAGISRPNSLQVAITTAGYDKTGIGYSLYSQAKSVLTGESEDTTFYPLVYEVPEGADLEDPEVWALANPSIGTTQSVDDFRRGWNAVKGTTADRLEWERYRFNRWTGTKDGWIDLAKWDQCKGAYPELAGAPCYLGLDLSSSIDLSSLSAIFLAGDTYYVRHWSWTTDYSARQRNKQNLTRYEPFTHDGSLTIVPGDAIDYAQIRAKCNELKRQFNVCGLVIEKWNWIQIAQELEKDGFQIYPFPPTSAYYNAPTRQLEILVNERRIVHDGNGLLRWALGNVAIDMDSSHNIKPRKTSEADKIDPIISVILGMSAALQHSKLYKPVISVYEDRGILVI